MQIGSKYYRMVPFLWFADGAFGEKENQNTFKTGRIWYDDVKVVFANPKTSANGRFAYLSALAYAEQHSDKPQDFYVTPAKKCAGFRGGCAQCQYFFTQRNIGDVLIAPENEAALAAKTLGENSVEVNCTQV